MKYSPTPNKRGTIVVDGGADGYDFGTNLLQCIESCLQQFKLPIEFIDIEPADSSSPYRSIRFSVKMGDRVF